MDSIGNRDNLFSRGPSPPPPGSSFHSISPSQNEQTRASPSSHRDASANANNALDSLFHNLTAPTSSQAAPQPTSNVYTVPADVPHSGPATPASANAGSISSTHSGPMNPSADKQNALLSLLSAVTSTTSNPQGQSQASAHQPQQVPTPPGSAPRMGTEQTKLLLDQLMSGTTRYNNDAQPQQYPPSGSQGPSPTYFTPQAESQPQQPQGDFRDNSSYGPQEPNQPSEIPPESQHNQTNQQHPPSPTRRSMFDFVSPFDALSASSQAKRKPVPPQPSSVTSGQEESTWPNPQVDPKRKSVENLMDQLTRGQGPLSPPAQSVTAQFDPYAPSEEPAAPLDQGQARASRPLPPQPVVGSSSPRASPPKVAAQARQQRRSVESPIGPPAPQTSQYGPKDNSPMPSNPFRQLGASKAAAAAQKGKNSPNPHQQNIVFDVSQHLDEVQAPPDAVKSTAIALVKVDSTFLPGTTIGTTHWVAYAMTKGRVRVISRSSGDRTLLQLPPLFPTSVAVSDMSVHGNRLAGVTSDGGFVVWELPEVIRDDVPGKIVLCVLPPNDLDPLHAVKWHPKEPDLVAVASETNVYLVNINDAHHNFGGDPIPQSELHRVGHVVAVPSPIVAFDFDIERSALATISEDSTLTMRGLHDSVPFWSNRIRGDELPSSLTFVGEGVVVGRKNGTIFQLLPIMSRNPLSTVKFVNGGQEDPDMFGHVNYDARIQTLWVANNRRESMIAFRINFDVNTPSPGGEETRGAYFDQVVEFTGPRPTIHFVILTADADPHGAEAHAACVAAKVPPGELALVAFSVHSSGVDQVLIRKEWYDTAFATAPSKLPSYAPLPSPMMEPKRQQQYNAPPMNPPMVMAQQPVRNKTPPPEDVEGTDSREEGRVPENKGKGPKGRNANWKNDEGHKNAEAKGKGVDTSVGAPPSEVTWSKEFRKVEDNLHTRIGRLIGKELDRQNQRLEDARVAEQANDFARQEKILKLISTELTKNTTRVVEMAIKAEVQSSVLPTLENITKNEVKAALNSQISKGLADSMKQNLPNEIERLLMRPEVSSHIARTCSNAVTPLVERHVKDAITKTLIPAYSQQSSSMHQELSREVHSEILNLKKEIITWQSEALRGQETVIRELEQSVRMLSDQIKYLTMNAGTSGSASLPAARGSPASNSSSAQPQQGNLNQLLRPMNMQPMSQPPSSGYQPQHGPFPQQQSHQPSPMHGPWFGPSNIAAPQASHPTAPPPVPQQPNMNRTPPLGQSEEWDDTYLAVLGAQDTRQLRELLARSNPEVIMPLGGGGPLSQAVVLTLVHRLSAVIGETPPVDEAFKSSLWWLQRAGTVLNTNDPLISPYVARVMPSVQQMLNSTKQRLAILPGGPLMDTARTISDIQDMLARKPM